MLVSRLVMLRKNLLNLFEVNSSKLTFFTCSAVVFSCKNSNEVFSQQVKFRQGSDKDGPR